MRFSAHFNLPSNSGRGAHVLEEEKVRKVKEMLASQSYSQRMIARLTGVSRVVVHRIATGKRKDKQVRIRDEWEQNWNGKPYKRCPQCGCKTRLPCLSCIIKKIATKTDPFDEHISFRIELELEEKHRIRYDQVKAWRESQKDPDFSEIPDNWPFRKRWKVAKNDNQNKNY